MSNKRVLICGLLLVSLLAPADAQAIVGGKPDNPARWPGVLMLRANKKNSPYGYVASCSATLVAPHWVLTAAHCLEGKKYAFVSQGFRLEKDGEWEKVKEIHRYRGWSSRYLRGDLALLKLSADWQDVQPISWTKKLQPESRALMMGWGATISGRHGQLIGFGTFRSTYTTIHSQAKCRQGMNPRQGARTICAGIARHTICQGDSGGPLLVNSPTGWKQIGIASFGNAGHCGRGPAYYTHLHYYRSWIESLLRR